MKDEQKQDARIAAQKDMLERFIRIYCKAHHAPENGGMCSECSDLFAYARGRLERCPHHPKPSCKKCPTHCYKPSYRDRIREVMRFSGKQLMLHGRLDLVIKYFF